MSLIFRPELHVDFPTKLLVSTATRREWAKVDVWCGDAPVLASGRPARIAVGIEARSLQHILIECTRVLRLPFCAINVHWALTGEVVTDVKDLSTSDEMMVVMGDEAVSYQLPVATVMLQSPTPFVST